MKKLLKHRHLLKTAIALMILGFCLTTAGLVMGARGEILYFENFRLRVNSREYSSTAMGLTNQPIEFIDVRARAANIIIATAPRGQEIGGIQLENISADSVELTDGRITIDARTHEFRGFQLMSLGTLRQEIRIYLPEGTELENLYARSTSGRVTIENIAWETLEARSTSGSVRVYDGYVLNPERGTTHVQSTSGRAELNLQNDYAYFNYALASTSGAIRVNGTRMGRRNHSGGSGEHPVTIRSTSGRVDLRFLP